jgi:hypothetical protein
VFRTGELLPKIARAAGRAGGLQRPLLQTFKLGGAVDERDLGVKPKPAPVLRNPTMALLNPEAPPKLRPPKTATLPPLKKTKPKTLPKPKPKATPNVNASTGFTLPPKPKVTPKPGLKAS